MNKFLAIFKPTARTRILDVGGLPRFWKGVPIRSRITILNLGALDDYERSYLTPNQAFVLGDGTRLEWEDQSFDIVFSNSMIEHLGTLETQRGFAREARRVGKGYWIQTPAREFPIEPHYFTFFVHWLPKPLQKRLLRNFTLWGLWGRPSAELIDLVLAELRLLRRSEVASLFPNAKIWTERLLGWPKSYAAYKAPQFEENYRGAGLLDEEVPVHAETRECRVQNSARG